MKRIPLVVATLVAALIGSSTTALADAMASANQHPVAGSGIQGRIAFTDDGSTLGVSGTATGLTPDHQYFSLIYGAGIGPGGVSETKTLPPTADAIPACNDVNRDGVSTITATQMVVGLWHNNNDGTGTLQAFKSKSGNVSSGGFIGQDALLAKTVYNTKAFSLSPIAPVTLPPGTTFGALLFFGFGVQPGGHSYAPIGPTWRTISIRDAGTPDSPQLFDLVACGLVT